MNFKRYFTIFIVLACLIAITGCGNKGALTLPAQQQQPVAN